MGPTLVLPIKPPATGMMRAARLFLSSPASETHKSKTKPPAPVVIDHTAFPHIIDAILAAAPIPALMRFRATSRAYYCRITPILAGCVVVCSERCFYSETTYGAIACSAKQVDAPLFPLHTPFPALARRVLIDALVHLIAPQWRYKRVLPAPSPSEYPNYYKGDSASDSSSFSEVSKDPAEPTRIDLGPIHVSFRPGPLLAYTRVLNIDARVPPHTLMALAETLARQGRIIPLVRLVFFPTEGWRTTCPIVGRCLVVFLPAIHCPSDRKVQEPVPALVPHGTRRVVFTTSGEHMISYPNLNAIYELPASVTEVVIHLNRAPASLATCSSPTHGAGYAHLGIVIGHALITARRRILVVIDESLISEDEDENEDGDENSVANQIMAAAPHAFPANLSDEEAEDAWDRIAFMTTEAYINCVGQHQWAWETDR